MFLAALFTIFGSIGVSQLASGLSNQQLSDSDRTLSRVFKDHGPLTITSFRKNPSGSKASEWVERIFGPKAVFVAAASKELLQGPFSSFQSVFTFPSFAEQASCSIEILGFVRLNTEKPFMGYNRDEPIVGNASISFGQSELHWPCFYRPGFERWRVAKFFWSTFFYCPAPSPSSCDLIDKSSGRLTGVLTMDIKSKSWKSKFAVNNDVVQTKNINNKLASIKEEEPSMAVCLILPYTSSDPAKETVNGAIMFEGIQYYALLGLKVIVYDKDGANHRFIMDGKYGLHQSKGNNRWRENVVYHPHTVLGLVDKRRNVTYDNTELLPNSSSPVRRGGMTLANMQSYTDDDKTATLTHCRFEASALYGIKDVLVSDFDEFLYCPGAASTFSAQRHWLDNLLTRYKNKNIDQMIFLQVWTAANLHQGYFDSPLSCLQDKVGKGKSIFECFAGVDYISKTNPIGKSVHIGHKCPLTDFHSSCQSSDCNCSASYAGQYPHDKYVNIPEIDKCYFIHLSSNKRDYVSDQFSDTTRDLLESRQSEIYTMLHRKPIK